MRSDGKYSKRINTATTTQVKVGASRLVRIVALTATTTTIALIDGDGTTNVALGTITLAGAPVTLDFDIRLTNGIRITTSGTDDILVVYE